MDQKHYIQYIRSQRHYTYRVSKVIQYRTIQNTTDSMAKDTTDTVVKDTTDTVVKDSTDTVVKDTI